jgi:hypothetical protein
LRDVEKGKMFMSCGKPPGSIAAAIVLTFLITGCSEVVSGNGQTVSIDTGDLGSIAPGTREWLSWIQARDHCARYSKSPQIVDLKATIATYECIPNK